MALVTKSLAPSGGDYSTLSSWDAAEQTDLPTAGDDHLLQISGDWTAADTTGVDLSGWVVTTGNTLTIEAIGNARHDGVFDITDRYTLSVTDGNALVIADQGIMIKGFQIRVTATSATTTGLQANLTPFSNIEEMIIECVMNGAAVIGIDFDGLKMGNNLIVGRGVSGTTERGIFATGSNTAYLHACTVVDFNVGSGVARGIDLASQLTRCKNNLVDNCTNDWIGSGHASLTKNNASSDGSAPGSNNRINQTFTFRSGADDYRLGAGDAGALGFGEDLSVDGNYPLSVDFEGNTRGDDWDIGADMFEALAGGEPLPAGPVVVSNVFSPVKPVVVERG